MRDTPEDVVKEARELLSKATPGPWARGGDYWKSIDVTALHGTSFVAQCGAGEVGQDNAALIARAPELLASMADEIERLRDELEKIKGAGVP